jgi:DNA-binding MarR family transcriptional regulator
VIVSLTPTGFALIEAAVTSHVATQSRLVAGLAEADFATLDRLIGAYLAEFEQDQS